MKNQESEQTWICQYQLWKLEDNEMSSNFYKKKTFKIWFYIPANLSLKCEYKNKNFKRGKASKMYF